MTHIINTTHTIITKGQNSKGVVFAIFRDERAGVETFSVWTISENYELGKIRKSWRYLQRNMTKDAAVSLFTRRTNK